MKIYRRFRTWIAPAIALGVMAAMFSLSSFVIGPAITGSDGGTSPPGTQQPGGHLGHHSGGGK